MNQTELAIKMNNRDRQIVQRLEKGGTNVSLNLLRLVAEALEVDIIELFKD
jgi:transcriptional regulator with XRE-family HTH domain